MLRNIKGECHVTIFPYLYVPNVQTYSCVPNSCQRALWCLFGECYLEMGPFPLERGGDAPLGLGTGDTSQKPTGDSRDKHHQRVPEEERE